MLIEAPGTKASSGNEAAYAARKQVPVIARVSHRAEASSKQKGRILQAKRAASTFEESVIQLNGPTPEI